MRRQPALGSLAFEREQLMAKARRLWSQGRHAEAGLAETSADAMMLHVASEMEQRRSLTTMKNSKNSPSKMDALDTFEAAIAAAISDLRESLSAAAPEIEEPIDESRLTRTPPRAKRVVTPPAKPVKASKAAPKGARITLRDEIVAILSDGSQWSASGLNKAIAEREVYTKKDGSAFDNAGQVRNALTAMEQEEVVVQNAATKAWSLVGVKPARPTRVARHGAAAHA